VHENTSPWPLRAIDAQVQVGTIELDHLGEEGLEAFGFGGRERNRGWLTPLRGAA